MCPRVKSGVVLSLETVDTVLLRNAIVLVGILVVLGYVLLESRGTVAVLVVLGTLALLYFAQQYAFTAVVLPELRRTVSARAIQTATQVQTAFEIGFTVKIAVIGVELGVEKLFTDDEPLRTLNDGLLDTVNVLVIVAVIVALSTAVVVSDVVLSTLSAVLALRVVQTGVDFALAVAGR
jgi:hypothetical protein